jgi:hypothetical protein
LAICKADIKSDSATTLFDIKQSLFVCAVFFDPAGAVGFYILEISRALK